MTFMSFDEICTDMMLYRLNEEDKKEWKNFPPGIVDSEAVFIIRDMYKIDHPANPHVKCGVFDFASAVFLTICERLR